MRRPIFCGWRSFGTVDGDRGVVEKSYFVVEDELRDGEVVVLCGREEVGGAAEGIRNGALADCAFGGALCFGDDEASADGVEDLFEKNGVDFVDGRETHAVGVRDDAGSWIHLVAVEEKMLGLEEGNGFAAEKAECSGGTDGGEFCFDLRWIYRVGGFAQETEEDSAVGAVADSGEGERSVEIDDDSGGAIEEICGVECVYEAQSCAHRADGMGAGGANADLEEFEETGVHAAYCRRGRRGLADFADGVDFLAGFFSACFFWRL